MEQKFKIGDYVKQTARTYVQIGLNKGKVVAVDNNENYPYLVFIFGDELRFAENELEPAQ